MMPSHILHGRPVPAECAVVEVTMIREGREFKDLDYPNEDGRIEKLVDAKGNFILWPCKDIIIKTRSLSIILPQITEAGGTPTSNMSKIAQNSQHQWLLLLLKTLKTQSSRRAQGKIRLLLMLKTLMTQSSKRAWGKGHLLFLLET
jgi:hypothetical protein